MGVCNHDIRLYGTTTIGPKGQIVIPKEIRDKLTLKQGDSITIIVESDRFIGLIRNQDINELMEYVSGNKSEK